MTEQAHVSRRLKAVSYARVSTGAQAESGLSTEAQHCAVDRAAADRGWQIIERITDDAVSGRTPTQRRPRLRAALARSTIELLRLYERAEIEGWTLAALDAPVGLACPESHLFIGVRALISEFESAMASARTTEALAIARSRGVRLGRPSQHDEATKTLASHARAEGRSLAQIAAELTSLGILTPTGKTTWSRSSVQSLMRTIAHDQATRDRAEAHDRAQLPPSRDNDPPPPRAA